ncbi:Leucine-rich repeat protein kinase family protein [Raphanus sativus]|nr:Leucine-rich repeat protein kinase family protein [Raphanus sativus]
MQGEIPDDIARLSQMVIISLSNNNFSGDFPFHYVYNWSSLEVLSISANGLSGSLRPDLGNILPKIRTLFLGSNYFTGVIPATLSNISSLEALAIENNELIGSIPWSFGNIQNLQIMALNGNSLGSYSSGDLDFLDALTNCTQLVSINVARNRLGGPLPASITNLSRDLSDLQLGKNFISGSIPDDIGNLIGLQSLGLQENMLTGSLPESLGKLSGLGELYLYSNRMSGQIPFSIANITMLAELYLSNNSFDGMVPSSLGQLPQTLGNCLSMKDIWLQGNSFGGSIPDISGFLGVESVDLSNNNLYGSIPRYFANFSSLKLLNLSINNFEGYVPIEGVFQNASTVLVFGNKNLCGGIRELQLKPCLVETPPHHPSLLKKVVIGVSLGISFLLLLLFIASLRWYRKRKNDHLTNNQTTLTLGPFHEKISYGDIRNATDGFSSSNLIGSGSFGTVFKALLPGESNIVAVKVLNMQRRGAMKSFMAECESLKDTRHRNLVRLLTACSSIDFQGNEFKALIYEFMPSGSLDVWLHPEEVEEVHRPLRTLTLLERLNIVIDVASVLDYLHVQCHEPIAHCDLKPSNVLLDSDLTAHVSDFGLARLLLKFDEESFFNQLSSSGVRGTIGYAAPEYGMGGQPSIHGDVYSFGVLLLEVFTGKRPTDELFGGNFTLHNYTKSSLPERVLEIADKSIYHNGLRVGFPISECLTLVLDVGLRCCEDSPSNRLAMSEAVKELISVREKFFKSRRTARS